MKTCVEIKDVTFIHEEGNFILKKIRLSIYINKTFVNLILHKNNMHIAYGQD